MNYSSWCTLGHLYKKRCGLDSYRWRLWESSANNVEPGGAPEFICSTVCPDVELLNLAPRQCPDVRLAVNLYKSLSLADNLIGWLTASELQQLHISVVMSRLRFALQQNVEMISSLCSSTQTSSLKFCRYELLRQLWKSFIWPVAILQMTILTSDTVELYRMGDYLEEWMRASSLSPNSMGWFSRCWEGLIFLLLEDRSWRSNQDHLCKPFIRRLRLSWLGTSGNLRIFWEE